MARNDLPQTVGAAAAEGWEWLAIRCVYCRRVARIAFAGRPPQERLAGIVSRMRCTRCPGLTPEVDVKIGFAHSRHEKPIGVGNGRIYKIGMT